MKVYLGLGSNLEPRRRHIENALKQIVVLFGEPVRISHLYETPALLPENAPSEWNNPYLNCAVEVETSMNPVHILNRLKVIEEYLGRKKHDRWAPREIDIDILLYGDQVIDLPNLKVPHPEILNRAFVLDPLKDLNPELRIPGVDESVLSLSRRSVGHNPIWMGIVNVTPDSFSDGKEDFSVEGIRHLLAELDQNNAGILDLGGVSTRPGAVIPSAQIEMERVLPVLDFVNQFYTGKMWRPRVSVDTYSVETAKQVLHQGIDILNDVSGLREPEMMALLRDSSCDYVLMHSLTVPADRNVVLTDDVDVVREVRQFFEDTLELLAKNHISAKRVILDPGIGFGKSSLQSLKLLQSIEAFQDLGCRIMVGHSRKSFMEGMGVNPAASRDIETVGVSLALAQKGVDILRVHNLDVHRRALLAFKHIL